ncbi:diacylglycerol kinase [Caldicellulosiruptoraceae bacterium PP1]
MKKRTLIESFDNAINGIILGFKTQRNMKIHFVLAILVLILSIAYKLNKIESLFILICIALVISSELFNTAIEATVDLLEDKFDKNAKIAKDVAAGAVLINAILAFSLGYLLFYDRLKVQINFTLKHIRGISVHAIFISLLLVAIIIIVVKAMNKRTSFLRGGMPSGHTALAFSAATAITFITNNAIVMTLSLFIAILVLESRIEAKIHSVFETLVGAAIGILVTLLILKLI